MTIGGVAQHLISYYKIEDVENGRLRSPSSLPELAALDISPEYLDKTHFRNPPKVEIGADGVPRYRGEADDLDGSPSMLSAPLAGNMPLLTDPAAPLASSSIRMFLSSLFALLLMYLSKRNARNVLRGTKNLQRAASVQGAILAVVRNSTAGAMGPPQLLIQAHLTNEVHHQRHNLLVLPPPLLPQLDQQPHHQQSNHLIRL